MPKRLVQVAVLLLASLTMLGASSPDARFDKLGHKLMCTCGCGEILLECNHMGCPDSPRLIADLRTQLAGGSPDKTILGWFADRYGATVLAAPIRGGFDLVAWIVPFAALALGLLGVFWLLRHWNDRHQRAAVLPSATAAGNSAAAAAFQERIRRDTSF